MNSNLFHRRNLLFVGGIVGIFLLLILMPLRPLLRNFFNEEKVIELSYAIVSAIVILGGWFAARRLHLLSEGGFQEPNRKGYWLLLLPLFFPGFYMIQNVTSCSGQILTPEWLALAGVFLLRGTMEEVMCRGLIQGYLEKHNPKVSRMKITVFTATVFALFHFVALFRNQHILSILNQVIYAFFMGLLFGALLYRTRNVWLLGLVHGIVNIAAYSCTQPSEDEGYASVGEYLAGVGGFILLFSPIVLFSWLLIKTYKPPARS